MKPLDTMNVDGKVNDYEKKVETKSIFQRCRFSLNFLSHFYFRKSIFLSKLLRCRVIILCTLFKLNKIVSSQLKFTKIDFLRFLAGVNFSNYCY